MPTSRRDGQQDVGHGSAVHHLEQAARAQPCGTNRETLSAHAASRRVPVNDDHDQHQLSHDGTGRCMGRQSLPVCAAGLGHARPAPGDDGAAIDRHPVDVAALVGIGAVLFTLGVLRFQKRYA